MKKALNLFLFFFLLHGLFAQEAKEEIFNIQLNFVPEFIDFSPNDKYLVLENETSYEVWNVENQKQVLAGNHSNKINRIASGTGITEGSGYFIFEKENIFLTVDYALSYAELNAYNLTTGEKLWQNNKLDMDLSTVEQIFRLAEANTNVNTLPPSMSKDGSIHYNNGYFTKDQMLRKLVNYMPKWSMISVNGKNGLQLVDLKTGATKWNQPRLKGGIGEIFYNEAHDIIIAVQVHNSQMENLLSKPKVYGLNSKTGDVLWTTEYIGDYIPNTAFVKDDILILPYYGLRLINITNGQELDGAVKESMRRSRKVARTMSVGMQAETVNNNNSNLILDENDIIHYFAGFQNGKHLNPTMGKKAYFQIDIKNDKFINVEENLAGNNNSVISEALTDDLFYVKLTRGISKTYILGMSRETGKMIFETDKIKNRFGSEYSPFSIYGDKIVDLSAKGLHTYDAKTGKEISFIDFKDIGVGKFRSYTMYKNGLILFGTKGVSITDKSGKVKKNFDDFGRIKDYRIGDEIWLVEKKRFSRLDAETLDSIADIEFKGREDVFFSPSGKYFVRTNKAGTTLNIYPM